MVDHLLPFCYNNSIIINEEFRMESNLIIIVSMALAYGAFLGYCLGRYQGYQNAADVVREIYRK